MFDESKFTDRSKELMIDCCKQYDVKLESWNNSYYNSGVMVISSCHKELFKKPDREIFSFYEQTYLNMMIASMNIKMHELHYHYNRMMCMDVYTGEERHASYLIHYAGILGVIPESECLKLIVKDLEKWESGEYNYRRHIYVSVSGGLGDQICAEPAIRAMRKLYPDDEFVVSTHFPRLFSHLDVEVVDHGRASLKQDTPYYVTQTLPGPETLQWATVSHLLCHTVDYSSIALLKRTLPLKDRTVEFHVKPNEYSKLYELIPEEIVKGLFVIHAGRHWETKTFPAEYWQAIIDGVAETATVCLIGKDDLGDPPDFIRGSRGTVDVKCPDGCYDLRNKISIGVMAALLSKASTLISNDSAPIHLAGAFDNWIILLPSCKHPDHVLPYRNGSVNYKTKTLYKKLILDEVESRPTQVYQTSVDIKVKNWDDYLLNSKDVVQEIIR
jgi:hypothetical protein